MGEVQFVGADWRRNDRLLEGRHLDDIAVNDCHIGQIALTHAVASAVAFCAQSLVAFGLYLNVLFSARKGAGE